MEVLTDLSAVERLLPEWRALTSSSARSALEAADWQLPLAQRYLTRYGIRFLAWRDGGQLVGVAPLSLIADRPPIRPVRQLAWWGSVGPRMRGLCDVVATDSARDAVLDSFTGWLRDNKEWDVLRVVRPQFESPTVARLRAESDAAGWAYADYANLRSTTFQVDLPDSEEGWEKHLGSKSRKVMRWEVRKFAERGGQITPTVAPEETGEALDAIERLLRERWGDGEVYFARDPSFRGLVHESIPALTESNDAWLTVARDDAGIQGVLVSVKQNGYAMALMVAMTSDAVYRPFSLGKHLFDVGLARGSSARLRELRLPVGRRLQGKLLARDAAPARVGVRRPGLRRQARSQSVGAARVGTARGGIGVQRRVGLVVGRHRRKYYMTRQRKYYSRQSRSKREASTRVLTNGRLVDTLSSGETGPALHRGRLTVPQVVAIAMLALAHFFDYATFLVLMSRHGLAAEANPIVVRIAQTSGIPGLTLAKVLTVAFAATLMVLIAPKRKWLAYGLLGFGVTMGLIGGMSNLASM